MVKVGERRKTRGREGGSGELYKVSDRQPSTERLKAGDYEPEPVSWMDPSLGQRIYLICRSGLVRDGGGRKIINLCPETRVPIGRWCFTRPLLLYIL